MCRQISTRNRQNYEYNKFFQNIGCLNDDNCLNALIPILQKDQEQRNKQELSFLNKLFQHTNLLQELEQNLGSFGVMQALKYMTYDFKFQEVQVYSTENHHEAHTAFIILQGKVAVLQPINKNEQDKCKKDQIQHSNYLNTEQLQYLQNTYPNHMLVNILIQGESFGSINIQDSVSNKKNEINICLEDCHLAVFLKKHYAKVQIHCQHQIRQEEIQFMRNFSIFERFYNYEVDSIMQNAVILSNLPANYVIYRINDYSQKLYFIKEGEVQLTLTRSDDININEISQQHNSQDQQQQDQINEVSLNKQTINSNKEKNSENNKKLNIEVNSQSNNCQQLRKQFLTKKIDIPITIIGPNQMFGEEAFLKINRQYEARIHSTQSKIYSINANVVEAVITRKYDTLNQFIQFYKAEIFNKKMKRRQDNYSKTKSILVNYKHYTSPGKRVYTDENDGQEYQNGNASCSETLNTTFDLIHSYKAYKQSLFDNIQQQKKNNFDRPNTSYIVLNSTTDQFRSQNLQKSQECQYKSDLRLNSTDTKGLQIITTPIKLKTKTDNNSLNMTQPNFKQQQIESSTSQINRQLMKFNQQNPIQQMMSGIKTRVQSSSNSRRPNEHSKNLINLTHSIDKIEQRVQYIDQINQHNSQMHNTNPCQCDTPLFNLQEIVKFDSYVRSLNFKKKQRLFINNSKYKEQQQHQVMNSNCSTLSTKKGNNYLDVKRFLNQNSNQVQVTQEQIGDNLPQCCYFFKPKRKAFINAIRFYKNQENKVNDLVKQQQQQNKLYIQKNKLQSNSIHLKRSSHTNNYSSKQIMHQAKGELIDRVADFMIDSAQNYSNQQNSSNQNQNHCNQINNFINRYTITGRCDTSNI